MMSPRIDVSALPVDLTLAEAVTRVADLPYSRYPVTDGSLDEVVGFVHVRDLLTCPPQTRVRDLARPVLRIPDTRRALPALAEMRRLGAHLAVVVDEYGGSAGIITLEDILEELVGDITDEFDEHARHAAAVAPTGDVDAQLRLDKFTELTGVRLPDGPYDTAAGWMLHTLGRVPNVGDAAEVSVDGRNLRVTVTRMRHRRVEGLRVAAVMHSA
jgi:putative hemolysin